MNPDLYLAYLAVVAVFFASPPGPSQLLMISNSLSHGVRRSGATVAGDLSANALQMTAAAFGLAALIASSATALAVIKWAGVAYLLWMGISKFLAKPVAVDASRAAARPGRLYRQGFFTSAANPKAVVFFAALFPQFIDASLPIWPQLLMLGGTYLVIDGCILFLYGWLAVTSLQRVKALTGQLMNRLSGAMMIGAALLLAGKDLGDTRETAR
ncbi:MAG: LysE family transporter [Pseudomonadota bacterium]